MHTAYFALFVMQDEHHQDSYLALELESAHHRHGDAEMGEHDSAEGEAYRQDHPLIQGPKHHHRPVLPRPARGTQARHRRTHTHHEREREWAI